MNDSHELQTQVMWLKGKLGDALTDIGAAEQDVKTLEQQLTQFLDHYYAEVGHVFEQIFALEKNITQDAYMGDDDVLDDATEALFTTTKTDEQNRFSQQEIKKIYRKLARMLHPDSSEALPQSQSFFPALHACYKEQNLALLLRMQHLLEEQQADPQHNIVLELEQLEKRHDDLLRSLDELRLKHHTLQHSKAYLFMRRVEWEKMCGVDLIARIRTQAQQRLAMLQQVVTMPLDDTEVLPVVAPRGAAKKKISA